MRTHIGERPYISKVYDKSFSYAGSLKAYMRLYTGERPYSCKVCDKLFSQAGNLEKTLKLALVIDLIFVKYAINHLLVLDL